MEADEGEEAEEGREAGGFEEEREDQGFVKEEEGGGGDGLPYEKPQPAVLDDDFLRHFSDVERERGRGFDVCLDFGLEGLYLGRDRSELLISVFLRERDL